MKHRHDRDHTPDDDDQDDNDDHDDHEEGSALNKFLFDLKKSLHVRTVRIEKVILWYGLKQFFTVRFFMIVSKL